MILFKQKLKTGYNTVKSKCNKFIIRQIKNIVILHRNMHEQFLDKFQKSIFKQDYI